MHAYSAVKLSISKASLRKACQFMACHGLGLAVNSCMFLIESWNDTGDVQEMSQEQLEEMMERQGQSQAQGSKQMEISLEEQKGSSAQDSDQQ